MRNNLIFFNLNILKVLHSFSPFLTLASVPFSMILLFFSFVGNIPEDLRFGIVSENITECQSNVVKYENCNFEKVSCNFIAEVAETNFMKFAEFSSLNDAIWNLKKGNLLAVVLISANLTDMIKNFTTASNFDEITTQNFADIYFDNTNYILAMLLKDNLQKSFTNFTEKLLTGCNISKKWAKFHIMNIEELTYGKRENIIKHDKFSYLFLA